MFVAVSSLALSSHFPLTDSILLPTRCEGAHRRPDAGVCVGEATEFFDSSEFARDSDDVRSRILVWYAKGSPDLEDEEDEEWSMVVCPVLDRLSYISFKDAPVGVS